MTAFDYGLFGFVLTVPGSLRDVYFRLAVTAVRGVR